MIPLDFDLAHYLHPGGYARAAGLDRDQDRWRDYVPGSIVEPNVERDLLAMTRVDKPTLLKRLFELGAAYSGQILSYTKMPGQLGDVANTTALARYLVLPDGAGLIAGLQKYAGSGAPRRAATSPKFNVLNPAPMTAGSGYSFTEATADRTVRGRIVESVVGVHLFNTASSDIPLHYWRQGSLEVDFVLQRAPRLIAMEVKSRLARRGGPKSGATTAMEAFSQRFRIHRSLIVKEGGVPLIEFPTAPTGYWVESA